jgi:hypothetical protein
MNDVHEVAELLKQLGFHRPIIVAGKSLVIELTTAEYNRDQAWLKLWFDVVRTDEHSVTMIEKSPNSNGGVQH